MIVEVNAQTIVTVGAVVSAVVLLVSKFANGVRWFDHQKEQDNNLKALQEKHDKDMKELRESVAREFNGIATEQTLLTYGVLACLKGLKEQGCNGPVTEAINKIEKHLNTKAHDNEGGF